ncbi:hypothetical protein NKH77_49405 [Streptomyces sp. M19]
MTAVEADPATADLARAHLRARGFDPAVHTAQGVLGLPEGQPYDAIVSNFAVPRVPRAWLAQTRPGGRIVMPWTSSWCDYGTLALTRHADGSAGGRFAPYGSSALMNGERAPDVELFRDVLRADQRPVRSATDVSPWAVAGQDADAQFAVGLMVPGSGTAGTPRSPRRTRGCGWPPTTPRPGPRWTTTAGRIRLPGQPVRAAPTVGRGGGAYRTWQRMGRPGIGSLGLTVTPGGGASVWLDSTT